MVHLIPQRKVFYLLLLCVLAVADSNLAIAAEEDNLHITFTTTALSGGKYGNKHVHVVWLADNSGAADSIICTVGNNDGNKKAVWAQSRRDKLATWWREGNQADRQLDVDARTGATQTVFKTYDIDWNFKKRDGSVVPDGTYRLYFELTNDNSGYPRHYTFFEITKGSSSWSIGPATQDGYNNVTITFTPASLTVNTEAATEVTETSARLNGNVPATGGESPTVYIYWGNEAGGNAASNWDHEINLGTRGVGAFSAAIADLAPGTTYFFRCYVENSTHNFWGTTESFTTVAVDAPFIYLAPEQLIFPDTAVGGYTDIAFDIINSGLLDLQVTSLEAIGLDKEAYSFVSQPAVPLTIAPGQKETVGIRFSPAGAQDYNYAHIAVGSNDPDNPVALLKMSGSGGPAASVALNAIGGVGGPCRAVALDADRVLIGQGAVLVILDASDPSELTPLGQVTVAGVITDIVVVGNVAYATLGAAGLAVVDIANPTRPILLDCFESVGHTRAVSATGSRMCTAEGAGGIASYDMTMPDEPILLNVYATAGSAAAVEIVGDLAYVLDEQSGLNIYGLGLVAHWKLDEAQGATAADSFSNKNGTVYGGAAWQPASGRIDGALQFNGTDAYAGISGYKGITGSNPRTCTAWIRAMNTGDDYYTIMSWGNDNTGSSWNIALNSSWGSGPTGALRLIVVGGTIVGTRDLRDDTWHHVAVVLPDDGTADVTEAVLYVDGLPETIAFSSASRAINTGDTSGGVAANDVRIGALYRADDEAYFSGLVDDVRIYDRALNAAEINNMVFATLGGACDEIEFGNAIAVSGTRAYVVDRLGGLFVVDIRDSAAPTLVGGEIRLAAAGKSITVSGSRAYVASGAGIEVLDLANPDEPNSLAVIDTGGNAEDVAVVGSNVYVAAGASGLSLWDASIPTAATQLAAYTIQATPQGVAANASLGEVLAADDAEVEALNMAASRNPEQLWASAIGHAQDIAVSGSMAYIATGTSGLQILELMSPAPAIWRGEFLTGGFATDVAVSGSTAIVACGTTVYALDVTTPASPALLGSWDSNGWAFGVAADSTYAYVANGDGIEVLTMADATPVVSVETSGVAHGIAVAGGLAYIADGVAGLQIFDISALPAAPLLIGAFDTPGIAADVSIVGDRVCIADSAAGVTVLDVSDPAQPTLYARSSQMVRSLSTAVADSRIIVADDTGGLAILAAQTWPTNRPGNLSGDKIVSLPDLVYLADNWLKTETMLDVLIGNFNNDTIVNLDDFATIAQNWLRRRGSIAGLVAFWQLDERTGDTTIDSSGNNHTGTLTGMNDDDWVVGQIAGALDFDGVDGYVQSEGFKGVLGGQSRTVCAWIKVDSADDVLRAIVSWGNNNTGGLWLFMLDNSGYGNPGSLRLAAAGGTITGVRDLRDGQWHHVAAVLQDDGSANVSEVLFYIDGVLEDTNISNPVAINTGDSSGGVAANDVRIGARDIAGSEIYFEGMIDEVRIYDRALSIDEIAELAK